MKKASTNVVKALNINTDLYRMGKGLANNRSLPIKPRATALK